MKKVVLTLITVVLAAGSSFAQMDKAVAELQKKSILDAVQQADKAVDKSPDNPRAWLDRAKAYLSFAASPDTTLTYSDLEASFKGLEYLNKAIELAKSAKKNSIVKEGEKLLEGKEQLGYRAFWNMGANKYYSLDHSNAYRYFKKVTDFIPGDTTALKMVGYTGYYSSKDDAKDYLNKYLDLGGNEIYAFRYLFENYVNLLDEENASKVIDRTLRIYPTNKEFIFKKFELYRAFKKYDEAIAYLNKLREKDSKDIVSIINLAFLYDYKVYLLNEELIAIKHTLSQTEGFDAKISAQKDKVIVFEEEIKNVTEKLKKTKIATQKAQYQAQISKYKELIEKEKKEATLLEEE
jgi:Tfp pilus assembly protein PilF